MKRKLKIVMLSLTLVLVCLLIFKESVSHFQPKIIEIKRKHLSAQHHWNIGYSRRYVVTDSPLRYETDLRNMKEIIEPGFALLSDKATSYYAAATLPVYIRNMHGHHGLSIFKSTEQLLESLSLCYLEYDKHRKAALRYLQEDYKDAKRNNFPILRYIILNKDKANSNLVRDCLATRSTVLQETLLQVGKLLYKGEFLNLYQLNTSPSQDSLGP